jgi:ATP sulfurylase
MFVLITLEIEALKIYDVTMFGFGFFIHDVLGLTSFMDYIHEWRLVVHEKFFKEFRSKDGI